MNYWNMTSSRIVPILVVTLTSCMTRTASTSVPATPSPQFERDFLQNRLAHQQAAIEMAQACVQKAQRPELKAFCSTLLEIEGTESKQLQSWLSEWYSVTAFPEAKERMTEGYRNFQASLRTASGTDFESAFLRAMRLHHHEGVRESRSCETSVKHTELKSLCGRMVVEQEREIKQISAWICEWFRDCVER